MPLPKLSRGSVLQKLLIFSIILVILLIMFLTIGPMFIRKTMVKQTTDIYPATDQEEMRIERNAKFYADSIQSEAIFDAPLALKLLVPVDQREALIRDFKGNIRKRQVEQCRGPNCPMKDSTGTGSSTAAFVSFGSTATGLSESTTAGAGASKSTSDIFVSTAAGGSSSNTGGLSDSTNATADSTGKASTSSVPGGFVASTAATSKNTTPSKSGELQRGDDKTKDADSKEKDFFAGCDCGAEEDSRDDDCDCSKDNHDEEDKDDGCDCSKDDDEWCKLDAFGKCVRKAKH